MSAQVKYASVWDLMIAAWHLARGPSKATLLTV
jgi:hypothetical protein